MPSLLDRLKQRKLVQWALAYLAGAWLLLQVVGEFREPWGWPDGLVRGIHVALVLGFFVALVLAWYHGEQGRQKVSGPELLLIAGVLGLAAVLLTLVGGESASAPIGSVAIPVEDDRPCSRCTPV